MTCDDVLPLLNLLADDALGNQDAARILEHLKECSHCQSEWDAIQAVRSGMRRMRAGIEVPAGLMDRVSKAVDRENKQQPILAITKTINGPKLAMVASLVLLIALGSYLFQHLNAAAVPVDVVALVSREFNADPAFELVDDREALSDRLGFPIRYLKFADWKINQAGTYRARNIQGNDRLIARFELERSSAGKEEKIYCYQGPAGSLQSSSLLEKSVGGKKIRVGRRGPLTFACWTENERDYLLLSPLPEEELEELVRSV
jgi:hypothetical protein